MKLSIPKTPTMFLKATETINHPSGHIVAPHCADLHDCHLDYEVELAVVIGKTCKDVSEDHAMEYVLGYMTANDVTARTHQNEVSQWDRGKGFDGFAPIGPALVSSRVIPDPSVLQLQTVLNGQVMQQGEASDMIFTVPKIVSFLSQVRKLRRIYLVYICLRSDIGLHVAKGDYYSDWDPLRNWCQPKPASSAR